MDFQRFFRCIRLATGSNDHPATLTALQVYKILNMYSTLMPTPSKFGNCRIQGKRKASVITLPVIKAVYSRPAEYRQLSFIEGLRNKLDDVVASDNWNVLDVIFTEHYYLRASENIKPSENNCLLYFVTGRVCKNLQESTPIKDCQTCTSLLK